MTQADEAEVFVNIWAGASLIGCAFVSDLPDLGGRHRLEALGYQVHALCQFSGH